jgi:hypothetical protein
MVEKTNDEESDDEFVSGLDANKPIAKTDVPWPQAAQNQPQSQPQKILLPQGQIQFMPHQFAPTKMIPMIPNQMNPITQQLQFYPPQGFMHPPHPGMPQHMPQQHQFYPPQIPNFLPAPQIFHQKPSPQQVSSQQTQMKAQQTQVSSQQQDTGSATLHYKMGDTQTITDPICNTYTGQLSNPSKYGTGHLTFLSENTYQGTITNNPMHGPGSYT